MPTAEVLVFAGPQGGYENWQRTGAGRREIVLLALQNPNAWQPRSASACECWRRKPATCD